jgi:hypothetical protein
MQSISLNSMEIALAAEFDLEMAHAYDEIADDATQSADARRTAQETAALWRERARLCRLEAQRLTAAPMVPDAGSMSESGPAYTGPERRHRERRSGERRVNGLAAPVRLGPAIWGRDRRVNPDRRRGERRR